MSGVDYLCLALEYNSSIGISFWVGVGGGVPSVSFGIKMCELILTT